MNKTIFLIDTVSNSHIFLFLHKQKKKKQKKKKQNILKIDGFNLLYWKIKSWFSLIANVAFFSLSDYLRYKINENRQVVRKKKR